MAEESTFLSPSPTLRVDARPSAGDGAVAAGTTGRGEGLVARVARRAVLSRLAGISEGRLELVEDGVEHAFGQAAEAASLRARVEVLDPRFYRRIALGGSTGAGEAYADGFWRADDLTAAVRVLARNARALESMEGGLARFAAAADRVLHRAPANTRGGSRRNVAAHYDLGNDFFATFLDPSMMYSCAVFPDAGSDLATAATHKLDLVCAKLGLRESDEVVEIGGGWGGFAVHAARKVGCRVVTTTLSRRQYDYARERVKGAGLEDRVEVLLVDFRDLAAVTGRRFDKLVSIEMVEAIGHRLLPRYFEAIGELLRPEGLALVQAIVIPGLRYETYRRSTDFIRRHIFPGSLLPSLGRMLAVVERHSDLVPVGLEDLTPHYALTLAHWRRRFLAARRALSLLGCSERFQRLWEFYFSYCEGGFLERTIGDVQLLLAGPRHGVGALPARRPKIWS